MFYKNSVTLSIPNKLSTDLCVECWMKKDSTLEKQ